jgi:hypothetical protein
LSQKRIGGILQALSAVLGGGRARPKIPLASDHIIEGAENSLSMRGMRKEKGHEEAV